MSIGLTLVSDLLLGLLLDLLFLDWLPLLGLILPRRSLGVWEVILLAQLGVKRTANPRKRECLRNVSFIEPLLDLLLEDMELILHLWVNVPLCVSRPESPEGVADDTTLGSGLFVPKDILSELSQNLDSLLELCSLLKSLALVLLMLILLT